MSKPQPRIEITCTEFRVWNGAILLGSRACGTVQFSEGKDSAAAIRRLRRAGIAVDFPEFARKPGKTPH